MTSPDVSETPSPLAAKLQAIAPFAAPAFVLLAIVLPFLRYNEYDLLLPESLILIGGAVAIGLAVGALSRLRPETLGPLLMALVLAVYVFHRQEVTDALVSAAGTVSNVVGSESAVLALLGVALFLAFCAISIALRRHIDTIVTAVFGTIVLTTLVLPVEVGGEPVQTGAIPKALKNLPPVIHIVLDEHIGLAGLPDGLPESDEARKLIPAVYKDFALYSHAYSRFDETKYSLTSLMNRDLGADVPKLLEGDEYVFAPTQNDWLATLKKEGYAIKVYQSAWFDMCRDKSLVDACYTYSFFSPNAIQRAPLSTWQRLKALGTKLAYGRGALQLEPMASMEALARFRSDIATAPPRGVAYIVHLLIPHFGYLYDEHCKLLDPSEWEREDFGDDQAYTPAERIALYHSYLRQLICANREMESLFAYLKELGVYDEATIIIHGDHGSRLGERNYITATPETLTVQDKIDHYAPLLAIKAPGIEPGLRDAPEALQNVFAKTFLGGALPDSPSPGDIFIRIDEDDHFAPLRFTWPDVLSPIALRGGTENAPTFAEIGLRP